MIVQGHHAVKLEKTRINPMTCSWRKYDAVPGPRFIRQDLLGRGICVRRVGNLFYTHDFAEVLFQEMILHNAKAVAVSSHDLNKNSTCFTAQI